jgi:hypothetical protein
MEEPVTVGLSAVGHDGLIRLQEDGYFAEMTDAFRFAIALGLAHGRESQGSGKRTTFLNVGSLDGDRSLYNAVKALAEHTEEPIYRVAERYAEWGVAEMIAELEGGRLSLSKMLAEAEEKLSSGKAEPTSSK